MKKLIGVLMVTLIAVAAPVWAGEDAGLLQSLEAKLAGTAVRADGPDYRYGTVLVTELGIPGAWTALGIYNYASSSGEFMVGCFDHEGKAAASGTFTLPGGGLKFGLLQNLVAAGTVPALGSIAIFGTQDFKVEKYVGLGAGPETTGAFGVVAQGAEPY